MNSDEILYSYNIPEYSQSQPLQTNYYTSQPVVNQNSQNITYSQGEYPVTKYNKTETINNYNQTYENYENNISLPNSTEQYTTQITSEPNQINSYEQYNSTNNNILNTEYQQQSNYQIDYNTYNNDINTNLNINNIEEQLNTYIPNNDTNQIISIDQGLSSNIINQGNELNLGNQNMISLQEKFPSFRPYNSALAGNTKSQVSDMHKSFPHPKKEEKIINSPKLVDPLETKIPPTPSEPSFRSMRSDKEELNSNNKEEKEVKEENIILKEENSKEKINNLTKDEQILLESEEKKKEYDINSHFSLVLEKDESKFFYKKVHKVALPLLGHYEMPDNLIYKSPILSPNQKYLACVGKGDEDCVFVWEMSDLYWYKYKYSYSKVDCIAFTPDSKSLIIVYSTSNPIMYDLSTGKLKIEFERNGEENNRDNYKCSFTNNDTHFALTNSNSYTLWSLRSGKIKQKILDESPFKVISNDHLIYIDAQMNCYIKKITDQSIIESFQIKGVESIEDILDARCTKDMANLIYVIKHGIIVYNFKNKEFNGLQKFECGVVKATLSPDGKYIFKTNMKNFCVYDLEKGTTICTVLKDKFKEYNINYSLKKIIIIDNISIIIKDFTDEQSPEKYVWLNKNPKKLEDVKFSRDFKILLARLNRNDAVVYDLKTGYIIKKWENLDENWLDYCITIFGGDKIAVKTNLFLTKIWNFSSGKEEATFYGFNSHSLSFSSDGDYLVCGTKNGSEIARIWNIDEQQYGIFKFNGSNNNYNTKVHLTYPIPKRLICCSVDQQPLIFNSYTKELLIQCECPYRFEEIYDIQSELDFDVFIVKGRDNKKRNIGIMYRISDGILLETYENYTVLELVRYEGILISKSDNINNGKLTATNFKNLEEPVLIDFKIQNDKCELLNDHKSAVIQLGDEFNKEFSFINVKNGEFMGKLNFIKKHERYSEIYVTADNDEEEIYFRYFELLTPEETMVYLKKNIFNVEEDNA